MNPNSQKDLFVFSLPSIMVPKQLEEKWKVHLLNYRKPFATVIDYVNSNIKEVILPAMSPTVVIQKKFYSKEINYRGSKSPYDLSSREFSVVFKNTDYNIFYYLLKDIVYYHYITNKSPFVGDFTISVLDVQRREQLRIVLSEINITGLSEITFANQEKDVSTEDLTMSFIYNYEDIQYIPTLENYSIQGELFDNYSEQIIKDNGVSTTFVNPTSDSTDDTIIGE
jgi:hypothetical protein